MERDFANLMLGLREGPNVADIRPIGLMCGIDLAPRADGPGKRGYEVMERAYHEHDLYIRVVADTLVVAPPLVATVSELDEIRGRIAAVLSAVG